MSLTERQKRYQQDLVDVTCDDCGVEYKKNKYLVAQKKVHICNACRVKKMNAENWRWRHIKK